MAELNAIEKAQAQDVVTLIRAQVTTIRARQKELQVLLETWIYLTAFHNADEISAVLEGENSGMTFERVQAAIETLLAMGATLDDPQHPERKLSLIALSHANVK